MSRHPRLVIPGLPHHVVQRGSRRQRTFFGEADYQRYLQLLQGAAEREGLDVPVFCLMPNHLHLIAIPHEKESLSRALSRVHQRYAEEVNSRFGWSGHLWQQRFGASPMDELHARNAIRYVLANPVRAGMVRHPSDWPWSNARRLLDPHRPADLSAVATLPNGAELEEWLVADESLRTAEALRRAARQNRPLGSEEFLDALEARIGRSLRPAPRGRPPRRPMGRADLALEAP